jgi:hypothetical protein
MKTIFDNVLWSSGPKEVHKLLLSGVSPNSIVSNNHTLLETLICLNNLEAAKLCVLYGGKVEGLPTDLKEIIQAYMERS